MTLANWPHLNLSVRANTPLPFVQWKIPTLGKLSLLVKLNSQRENKTNSKNEEKKEFQNLLPIFQYTGRIYAVDFIS